MQTYDPHKSTNQIRQGNKRMMPFRVLIISTLAIIVLFAAIFIYYAMHNSPTAL